ncbi:glycine-rich protein 1-like [Papilio machaon]|uniref:glycine-rich protein 1-like n=1 Tax=Papilio machaon TaxID=76193 RepID=UPI001E663FD6|nr:glycine-rich protein 1-like [Papilio machaon]
MIVSLLCMVLTIQFIEIECTEHLPLLVKIGRCQYESRWRAGSRVRGAGCGEQDAGSREQGAGSREQGAGSREQDAGSREQGVGSRVRGAGEVTCEALAEAELRWDVIALIRAGAGAGPGPVPGAGAGGANHNQGAAGASRARDLAAQGNKCILTVSEHLDDEEVSSCAWLGPGCAGAQDVAVPDIKYRSYT